MQREIIFKGKRIGVDKWITGYLIHINNRPFIFEFGSSISDCAFVGKENGFVALSSSGYDVVGDGEKKIDGAYLCEVIPESVGQYLGRTDKNGKDIYEGHVMLKLTRDFNSDAYLAWVDAGYESPEPPLEIRNVDYVTLEHHGFWLKNESFGYEGENLEDFEDWEIIGSKFDNPELLTQ